jgi:membrane-associated phospholipid phosphatase
MFRTDFNIWLQQFESEFLTFFMQLISFFGNVYPLIVIAILSFSLFHFRKGVIILNILAFTAVITTTLKSKIDYPRPIAVDNRLIEFDYPVTDQDFTHLQPGSAYELFSFELLDKTRSRLIGRFGLPSGHTSLQFALWISAAMLFKKRWLWVFSIAFITLTGISRMYLGLHYPVDIVGGILTGGFALFVIQVLLRYSKFNRSEKIQPVSLIFLLFPIIPLLLFIDMENWQSGIALGANIAFYGTLRGKALPKLTEKMNKRLIFSLFSVVVFLSCFFMSKYLTAITDQSWQTPIMIGAGALAFYVIIEFGKKFEFLKSNVETLG